MKEFFCVTLIGMPGAGKTTVGKELASELGYAFMDSDFLLESIYGRRLQDVTDNMERETFLNAEAQMILSIRSKNCVIATGGSVIYRARAMEHLKGLGPVIYLELSLEEIKRRIAINPQRGISFAPGQTLENLYEERITKYKKYADLTCEMGSLTPIACAKWIKENLHYCSF